MVDNEVIEEKICCIQKKIAVQNEQVEILVISVGTFKKFECFYSL